MELALGEAEQSLSWGDVPIGAVVTRGPEVLAHAGNQRERLHDPTAHAELLAIRRASAVLKSWRLGGGAPTGPLGAGAVWAGGGGPRGAGPARVGGRRPRGRPPPGGR